MIDKANPGIVGQEIQKNKTDPLRHLQFDNLMGGTEYMVEVVTVSGDQTSEPISVETQTCKFCTERRGGGVLSTW